MDAQYERNIHSAFFLRLKTKGLLSPAFLVCCTPHFEKVFSLSQHGFQFEPILEGCFLLCVFFGREFQLGSMPGWWSPPLGWARRTGGAGRPCRPLCQGTKGPGTTVARLAGGGRNGIWLRGEGVGDLVLLTSSQCSPPR